MKVRNGAKEAKNSEDRRSIILLKWRNYYIKRRLLQLTIATTKEAKNDEDYKHYTLYII